MFMVIAVSIYFILFIIIFIPIDSYTGREIDYVSK